MSTLDVTGLNVWYGRFQALKDVSIPPINKGEFVGLIGPNAAGKSTLLNAFISRKNARHNIDYKGQKLSSLGRTELTQIFGLMTQAPPQPSSLTPFELIWSLARALDLRFTDQALHEKISQLFEQFGLTDVAFKALSSLSGGKRQLVGVVMVLLRSPEVCLLDEPTSALDLHWRLIVLGSMRRYIESNGAIGIAALHDLDLAARFCHKLVLLHDGAVVATGTPREVITEQNMADVYQVEALVKKGSHGHLMIEIIGPIPTEKS